jgi:hypothetical protein
VEGFHGGDALLGLGVNVNVIAWGLDRLVVFVDPSAPCGRMRCSMDNMGDSLGHQSGFLGVPSDASALLVSVVVEIQCDCGGRGHRYNLWGRKRRNIQRC